MQGNAFLRNLQTKSKKETFPPLNTGKYQKDLSHKQLSETLIDPYTTVLNISISVDEVRHTLKSLTIGKASRPYKVNIKFLKETLT